MSLPFLPIVWSMMFVALLVLHAPTAASATIEVDNSGDIYLEGPIEKGDFEKFRQAFVQSKGATTLTLNSPGGDLSEALLIARMVRDSWIVTAIYDGRLVGQAWRELPKPVRCDSACTLIFIAGAAQIYGVQDRQNGRPVLGFHRAYLDPNIGSALSAPTSERAFRKASDVYVDALVEFGAPVAFVEKIMRTRSDDLLLVSASEFYSAFGESRALGDGIPWLEEFFTARCGPRLTDEEYEWMDKHRDDAYGKTLNARIYQRLGCVNQLNNDHQNDVRKRLGDGGATR